MRNELPKRNPKVFDLTKDDTKDQAAMKFVDLVGDDEGNMDLSDALSQLISNASSTQRKIAEAKAKKAAQEVRMMEAEVEALKKLNAAKRSKADAEISLFEIESTNGSQASVRSKPTKKRPKAPSKGACGPITLYEDSISEKALVETKPKSDPSLGRLTTDMVRAHSQAMGIQQSATETTRQSGNRGQASMPRYQTMNVLNQMIGVDPNAAQQAQVAAWEQGVNTGATHVAQLAEARLQQIEEQKAAQTQMVIQEAERRHDNWVQASQQQHLQDKAQALAEIERQKGVQDDLRKEAIQALQTERQATEQLRSQAQLEIAKKDQEASMARQQLLEEQRKLSVEKEVELERFRAQANEVIKEQQEELRKAKEEFVRQIEESSRHQAQQARLTDELRKEAQEKNEAIRKLIEDNHAEKLREQKEFAKAKKEMATKSKKEKEKLIAKLLTAQQKPQTPEIKSPTDLNLSDSSPSKISINESVFQSPEPKGVASGTQPAQTAEQEQGGGDNPEEESGPLPHAPGPPGDDDEDDDDDKKPPGKGPPGGGPGPPGGDPDPDDSEDDDDDDDDESDSDLISHMARANLSISQNAEITEMRLAQAELKLEIAKLRELQTHATALTGQTQGPRPEIREAESVNLGDKLPSNRMFKIWRNWVRHILVNSSRRPADAYVWVNEIEDESVPIEKLQEPGLLGSLCAKLGIACMKFANTATSLGRDLMMASEKCWKEKGVCIAGRVLLRMIYSRFAIDMSRNGTFYTYRDVTNLSLIHI